MVPEEFVAESLLASLEKTGITDGTILLPCSEDARDTLYEGMKKLGARVDRIHIYRPEKPEPVPVEEMEEVRNAHMITFASSSTVRHFFDMVPETKAVAASIGPVTSSTLRELGHAPVVEAGEYTIDGLVQAITDYYREKN